MGEVEFGLESSVLVGASPCSGRAVEVLTVPVRSATVQTRRLPGSMTGLLVMMATNWIFASLGEVLEAARVVYL